MVQKTIKLKEHVDVGLARKISKNLGQVDREKLEKYVSASVSGWVDVTYIKAEYGRYTCKLSKSSATDVPTYTTMSWKVRNILCHKYVHDIDIVNAGPTIMSQSFFRYGLHSPCLTDYIQNRENRLAELMTSFELDRTDAKKLIITLLNHGTAQSWADKHKIIQALPGWVKELEQEVHFNIETLLQRRPDFQRIDKWIGSQISAYYFTEERKCLDALYHAIKKSKMKVTTLIHDGVHVLRMTYGSNEPIDTKLLRKWESSIYEDTGYTVALSEKGFELDTSLLQEIDDTQTDSETSETSTTTEEEAKEDLSHVRKLLKMLNRQRADSPNSWEALGRVLHSFSDDLLEDWIRFSKKSFNFEEGACEAKWAKFKRPQHPDVTTLRQWARKDSPEVFTTSVPDEVIQLWDKGDRGLAEMAHRALKDVIRLPSTKGRREFFYFDADACLWRKVSDGTIKVVISRALETDLRDVAMYYLQKAQKCENESEKRTFDTQVKSVQRVISYILTNHGLGSVVALAADMFLSPNFEQELDQIPHLIGVKNGVVDLRDGSLRKRQPEDMIYNVLDVDYSQTIDTSDIHAAVKNSMADDEELTLYIQKLLGYGITGEQSEEIFVLFNGSGRNGKGLLMQTLNELLKGFYAEMSCAVVASRVAANLDAERAKLQGARIACFNELDKGERMKTDQVQLLSGGDGIPACPKYKDPITIKPRHLCIMTTNHLPEITEVIPAIVARIIVVEFPVKFVDNFDEDPPSKYVRLKDTDLKRRFEQNLPAFFRWLVIGAVEWYKTKDLKKNAPMAVKAFTNKYLKNQDRLEDFINQCCEIGSTYFVPYNDFTREYQEYTMEDRINSKVIGDAMEKKGFNKKTRMINCVKYRGYEGLKLKELEH